MGLVSPINSYLVDDSSTSGILAVYVVSVLVTGSSNMAAAPAAAILLDELRRERGDVSFC